MTGETRRVFWMLAATLSVTAALFAGCQDSGNKLQAVQRAVGEGAQGALMARPTGPQDSHQAPSPNEVSPADCVPTATLEGTQLRLTPDTNHQEISSTRSREGFGLTWTDGSREAVYFGRTDAQGHALGSGVKLHAIVPVEEGMTPPSVVATADGYAVAWADPSNGRVRMARLDGEGHPRGRVSIVHDGIESPQTTRLAWSGHEYGLAVGLWQGVYFTRVSAEGERVGEPVILAEGTPVSALEGVQWDGRAYELSFTTERQGRVERVRQRVNGRGERRGEAVVVGYCAPTSTTEEHML